MSQEIWLIRHAETEWSRDKKHTGRTDVPLLDEGREHARSLRERLEAVAFEAVFTSPLSRARETCELAGLGDRMELEDALMEWDYGDYEGQTTEEVREERPDWYLWRDGCPGGESPADLERRADAVIERALAVDGCVALFAHGHILRAVGARWAELPVEAGGRLALVPAAVCILGFERKVRVIGRWNDAG